jgi:hypothetical protein
MVKQSGGEGLSGLPMGVGKDLLGKLTDSTNVLTGAVTDALAPSPQAGGRHKRRHGSSKRHSKRRSHRKRHHGGSKRRHASKRRHTKKGGDGGIVSTAAVPFGLLALQRYFKGNKSAKNDVRKIGSSFKRTFRR